MLAVYSIPCLLDRKCLALGLNASLEEKIKSNLNITRNQICTSASFNPKFFKQIRLVLPRKTN
jgi:hypothetical protein